jgi:hypothetical protein
MISLISMVEVGLLSCLTGQRGILAQLQILAER